MTGALFPFSEYWIFYLVFTAAIVVLLTIDLRAHRTAHAISYREAGAWVVVWITLAMLFCGAFYLFSASRFPASVARQVSLEFLAGSLMEESLSVDNMFVFALIFRYFAVPSKYQHRVLFYGVLGAMVFRGIFIAAGSLLIRFHWVVIAFGIFLIFTGIRMAMEKEKELDPGSNPVIRLVRRWFPVTDRLHGNHFVVRHSGATYITPLLIVLLALETTDILFAVDSVPAVFGVTKEPLVVYTSNVFAILGLRAMYFLLAGAMDTFHVLKYGLAFVLVFVGVKMSVLDSLWGGKFPIGISLAVIVAAIGTSVALSILFPKKVEVEPVPPEGPPALP
jgi:tellurite resistance protein TerC